MLSDQSAARFRHAAEYHRAKRYIEAEALYRELLASEPSHGDVQHALGLLLLETARSNEAVQVLTTAAKVKAFDPKVHFDLGNAFLAVSRLLDAAASYQHAIQLRPEFSDAHNNLGYALLLSGRAADAVSACARAVSLAPNGAETHFNLANALASIGGRDDAVAAYRRTLALRPVYPEAHFNLAAMLADAGQRNEAIAHYRSAIDQRSDWPEAHYSLGHVLLACERIEEAERSFARAAALRPSYAEAHNNLGITFRKRGRIEEALECFDRAIALSPNYADAHWNRAGALLLTGDYRQGFAEYEWRWQLHDFTSPRRDFAQPLWRGETLAGQTILLHAEQGFGDTIQALRYVPLVAERGARVIVECQPQLRRLAERLSSVAAVQTQGDALSRFDLHCPLMSLPLAFGTTLETIPAVVPYLRADPVDIEQWRRRTASDAALLKVGIVWGGSAANVYNRERSVPLRLLLPLLAVPGVSFYSLQKGEPSREAAELPESVRWTDWTNELRDFADTAALISNLDLVIGVDTAVCHLAGALAKPVWTMHPFAVEWRWLRDRSDSPWYPTMRLFRQKQRGQWIEVVSEVAAALRNLVTHRNARSMSEIERTANRSDRAP